MQRWLQTVLALLAFLSITIASELAIDESKRQQCNGMYSKNSWGGSEEPAILMNFENSTHRDHDGSVVSLVIFEWQDQKLLGFIANEDDLEPEYICDDRNIKEEQCNSTQIGQFILKSNATAVAKNPIVTYAVDLKNPKPITYPIKKTGYYCVWTNAFTARDYRAVVVFQNAYGQLPAAQIAKLPFYGGLTIVYAVIGAFWAFLYVQNRHDILPVQNYITAIIVFLIIEQLMTWGFYDYQNRHGNNAVSKVLMIITAILNAGRNSFSFFLLLIVCMGYGVVKPTLGKTMIYVRILAIAHFIFGVVYGIASLSITPDSAGPLVLFVILPLAATLTAFYVWTLNSLNLTMKYLMDRKQATKGMMYKKLWWCILGSIIVIFAFFFFNSFTFASRSDPGFVPHHWKTRWFILDGWLNIVYLFDISFVAYLWRPTANNRRFAMSDELAQDDEGAFEIPSLRGSFDDEESDARSPPRAEQPSGRANNAANGLSSMPPKPVNERHDRRSLDGETIFAVGEDGDKWSDDEESPRSSQERSRLTSKDK